MASSSFHMNHLSQLKNTKSVHFGFCHFTCILLAKVTFTMTTLTCSGVAGHSLWRSRRWDLQTQRDNGGCHHDVPATYSGWLIDPWMENDLWTWKLPAIQMSGSSNSILRAQGTLEENAERVWESEGIEDSRETMPSRHSRADEHMSSQSLLSIINLPFPRWLD